VTKLDVFGQFSVGCMTGKERKKKMKKKRKQIAHHFGQSACG
jgi:hypothetical protein